MVALVVAHVEPFHLQHGIRHWNVAGRELFGDAQHLLKAMEMIHWRHHEFLMEHMVAAGCQVDVLAILRRAFVERFDHKKINRLIEIDCQGAIMLRQNHRRVDGFWKVLVEHLLPVGKVPTQEYVLELLHGLCIVQINLIRSADEVVDHFIECELDAKLAQILMDFGLLFVARRVALQLVDIAQRCLFSPGFLSLKEWHSLVNRGYGLFVCFSYTTIVIVASCLR